MKRCIFHYPAPIADAPGIGSALRPKRMLAAFRAIGYEVEEVTGSCSSAGNCQADEQTLITQLSRPGSRD